MTDNVVRKLVCVLFSFLYVFGIRCDERCLACCEDHGASDCDRLAEASDPLFCPPDVLKDLDTAADEMCDLDGVNTLDRHV